MTKQDLLDVIQKVNSLNKGQHNSLPDNSYFLDDTSVLCYPRKYGDSRYPYYSDGLVLFAHTSGYIDCVEGMFNIFRCQHYNEDTPVCFWAGEKTDNGYFPFSITGAARQLFEPTCTKRYTLFTPTSVWYITETSDAVFVLRVHVDKEKHIHFSCGALNTGKSREIYLASFFEPMLSYDDAEGFYHRMIKYGEHFENGSFIMHSRNSAEDCLSIITNISGNVINKNFTTAKRTFLGLKGANLTNALSLKEGCFTENIPSTNTTDIPCASEFVHFEFLENEFVCLNYEMISTDDYHNALEFSKTVYNQQKIDAELYEAYKNENKNFESLNINLSSWKDKKINNSVFNSFIKCVQRQISFCALGKNYAGSMLGIRDVFQQLETSLMWQKEDSRKQIVKVMNYILDSGRPPRQISFPTKEKPIPDMDLRPFIDQGFWIISTLHTYISYTNDRLILDEICGYYHADSTYGPLSKSARRDSILEHLICITDYLVSNIDEETGCVHALFGDWNDALDGLGKTDSKDSEFGTGVSVMATEQLYLSLEQMIEILEYSGMYPELQEKYRKVSNKVAEAFRKYAVDTSGDKSRIIHGWGDKRKYLVGSFNDYDGRERLSLTSNSFFAISGLCNEFPELKYDITKNIMSLDSKYGLLTFDESFEGYAPEVGRISNITPGTFENKCVYVHGSTFGIMALFAMGEAEKAWEMLEKAAVITHDNATKTTFVMPNSYCYSEKIYSDGDSMSDWYTGSGTVLVKGLIKHALGIYPVPSGLWLSIPTYMPCDKADISIHIKGVNVNISYLEALKDKRITVNGLEAELVYDDISETFKTYIPNEKFTSDCCITVEM